MAKSNNFEIESVDSNNQSEDTKISESTATVEVESKAKSGASTMFWMGALTLVVLAAVGAAVYNQSINSEAAPIISEDAAMDKPRLISSQLGNDFDNARLLQPGMEIESIAQRTANESRALHYKLI